MAGLLFIVGGLHVFPTLFLSLILKKEKEGMRWK